MRNACLFFVLLFSTALYSQHACKTLKDSVFAEKERILVPAISFEGSTPVLSGSRRDSIKALADFIRNHPNLYVEVDVHTSSKEEPPGSHYRLSYHRAVKLRRVLISEFQVDSSLFEIKGYGSTRPRFTDKTIAGVRNPSERDALHALNNRVELRVLVPDRKAVLDSVKLDHRKKLRDLSYRTLDEKTYRVGDKLIIPAVAFELGRAQLREGGGDSLNKVSLFLKTHPYLLVEIGVHLDNHWTGKESTKLDVNRAKSCADYLEQTGGISTDRLVIKGYGNHRVLFTEQEVARYQTEESRELAESFNRSTELRILYIKDTVSHVINKRDSSFILYHTLRNIREDIVVPTIDWMTEGTGDSLRLSGWKNWALDELGDFLQANPDVCMELGVYLNREGQTIRYDLERKKATLVYDYLVTRKHLDHAQLIPKPNYLPSSPARKALDEEYRKRGMCVVRLVRWK